ncbi:UDP-N-acetyl-D-mannosamine dehydrogenase [Tessaracoccus flavus]|uniref:UDP-N-acetyl-D-mannosamine dehydrogenase n=1 Tax=Tessaracoccus flavus TaxID=1610493 RepID=A0A1Q2CBL2_9ACTN|nr:UDP-N-acetyl-D-mannosamine dehydrogenase [Tessaracoccus flavus]AQP43492.1 UDP-N-acetyl-D-mannosamine dehydrogenase [Tessaracoccus flavus]SDY85095.1 UDP-N-acetyl-D-mannosaminuronic acid dehydrogenase [Tessaracoccus flavus]
MSQPDVCVVGLGYIGLPTAAIFAHKGLRVHGVDVSPRTVDAINAGKVPFVEPDLGGYVQRAVAAGKLTASGDPVPAKAFIIAVPTPFKDGHEADLSYIESATRAVAPHLSGNELLILESTSPPGATEFMASIVAEERPELADADLKFAHCPERVLPGRVMVELVINDRIVGGLTPEAAQVAAELYRVFCEGEILLTDAKTAEMAKLVENSFRDVNIAFANELSVIADEHGIDVWELIELANHHPRVNILQPGPGVGGHCIAVDPWFIVSSTPTLSNLIRTAREVNDAKPDFVMDKVKAAIDGVDSPKIAALGLAFKPNIDDLRESPALAITERLSAELPGAQILAVEPHVDELPAKLAGHPNVSLVATEAAVREADVVLVLVDHTAFKSLDRSLLEGKTLIDTRGLYR